MGGKGVEVGLEVTAVCTIPGSPQQITAAQRGRRPSSAWGRTKQEDDRSASAAVTAALLHTTTARAPTAVIAAIHDISNRSRDSLVL